MKTLRVFLAGIALIAGISCQAANGKDSEGNQKPQKTKVDVYYFHTNTRCATCKAIEAEAQQDVKELYGNDVSFTAYNLDEKEGEAKGKELDVNGQALLIVKGNKKINITNEGFLYARTNPEKFKAVIQEKIKPLL